MIQRIQTLYLLLTGICTGLLFFFPVTLIGLPVGDLGKTIWSHLYTYKYIMLESPSIPIDHNWYALSLNIATTALAFLTILCYKKRLLQLRLCIVNIILMIGLLVLIIIQSRQISLPAGEWHLMPVYCAPVIGIILTWLAAHGILKDITLLKSYDRIR
ncbi:MAG: DUF4293 domain-containing protein [Culturomica sp.]|jgi:hypothetical protein|nr:DUF4293 domain-containing protein [Culturomica sp.]